MSSGEGAFGARAVAIAFGALEALAAADGAIAVRRLRGTPHLGADLEVLVDGSSLLLEVTAVAYATGDRVRALLHRAGDDGVARPFLVADRMTLEAKDVLARAGWSWLDGGGHLHLRGPGVRIDLDVPAAPTRPERVRTGVAGRAETTIAYWLCDDEDHERRSDSPTGLAPLLSLAPSTISTATRQLKDAGLVTPDGAGVFPELFWALAEVWAKTPRVWLATMPDPTTASPDPDLADLPSWRRSGDLAASRYGAPIVSGGQEAVTFYVPGPVDMTIASRRYGVAPQGRGAASLAVAPAPLFGPQSTLTVIDGWPLAPKIAAALDLATDSRGRETLGQWKTPGDVWRD